MKGERKFSKSAMIRLGSVLTFLVVLSVFGSVFLNSVSSEERGGEGPSIETVFPENGSFINQSGINFSVNISGDYNITNVTLEISNSSEGGPFLEKTRFDSNKSNIYSWTINSLEDGIYNWTIDVTYNDSEEGENLNSTKFYGNFTVDTTFPIFNIISNPTITDLSKNHTINFTVNDTNLDKVWYEYNETNITLDGVTSENEASFNFKINENELNLTIWANDSVGNVNNTSVTFTVDTIPPEITINSPKNETYNTSEILLNISTIDSNLNETWYSLDDGITNTTYREEKITFNEGLNTLIVWANDSVGNVNNTSVTFTVDTIPPEITIISPENKTYNTSEILLNISVDDNSGEIWYSLDDGENNDTYNSADNITLNEGLNTLIVWANDSVGNVNNTSVTFTVDTIPPEITIISPENKTYNTSEILLNISVDDNSGEIWYSLDDGENNDTYNSADNITLNEGLNTLIVWANDSVGNVNNTSVTFTIKLPDPPKTSSKSSYSGPLNISVSDSSVTNGYTRVLRKDDSFKFNILNESHLLTLDEVLTDSIRVTVRSEPKEYEIKINETQKIDFDEDGYYDLEIGFSKAGIVNYSAYVYLKAIDEEYELEVVEESPEDVVESEDSLNSSWSWAPVLWSVLVVILVVAAVYFFYWKNPARKKK